MGACACVDLAQKSASTSYIDISTNVNTLLLKDSTQTIGMVEPSQKTSFALYKDSDKSSFSKPNVTKQPTLPSLKENSNLSNLSISPYKSYNDPSKSDINITLLGHPQTGKSAFVIKYVNSSFEKHYIPSISIEHYVKKKKYNNIEMTLNFKVAPGDKGYHCNYDDVLCKNDFMFVFYDVTVRGSFKDAVELVKNVGYEKVYSGGVRNVLFVGSKLDIMQRREDVKKIQEYCNENGYRYFEISSKNKNGFKELVSYVLKMHSELIMTMKE